MRTLSVDDQKEYRQRHFAHRLALLPYYSSRRAASFDWNTKGDLFRCAKDSALICIRLFLCAMGLKGHFDRKKETFILIENSKLRDRRDYDDILIDQLGGALPDPASWSLTADEARLLAGVYKRADKELAHLTVTFNDEFNDDEVIGGASRLVVTLLSQHLYSLVHEDLPKIDL